VPTIFFYSLGRPLLLLHMVAAIVLGGSSVHHAVIAVLALRGRPPRLRLARLYALVALLAYLATLASGGLLYPRYRYFVRGLYLDRHAPWASNLFDFKENLATLGLPLAVGALIVARDLRRHLDAGAQSSQKGLDRQTLVLYGFFALGTATISLFNLVAGILCTSVHGI
jgi:hypothetical protein